MKYVGLRFLLEFGHFVDALVLEQEAEQIIIAFGNGGLKGTVGHDVPVGTPYGIMPPWRIDVKRIIAVHVKAEDGFGQSQTGSRHQAQPWLRNSGLPN